MAKPAEPIKNLNPFNDEETEESVTTEFNETAGYTVAQPIGLLHHSKYQATEVLSVRRSQVKDNENNLIGNSIWIFKPENGLRKLVARVINHKLFNQAIMFFIIVSTLTLALE